MTAHLRKTNWVQIDDSKETRPAVVVPEAVAKLMADRHLAKHQTTVTIGSLGSRRFQIDQRTPEGVSLRRIVLEVSTDDPTKATVSGYQVLMTKVGEEWQPEDPQRALDELAKGIVTSAPAT
jgi:hypothetical protein